MGMIDQNERLGLLIRMLDPEDYRFIAAFDLRTEIHFRRKRMKIYRGELREIAGEALRSYRAGLSNINAAGRWSAYPDLVWNTLGAFSSIATLWMAGSLFRLRLPVMFDVAARRERLQRFLTDETRSAKPGSLP